MADEPKGKNGLNSLASFEQRNRYDNAVPEHDNLKDFWKESANLYGKVDWDGTPVLVKESKIIPIPGNYKKVHYVLDFVSDAFVQFRNFYKRAMTRGVISKNTSIFIKPVKSWNSINDSYNDMQVAFGASMAKRILSQKTSARKIKNFDNFIKSLSDACATTYSPNSKYTKSGHILSRKVGILQTGLVIELSDASYDNDNLKFRKFFQDENFLFYVEAAKRFGFFVDKNVPWRLVADLHSPAMIEFLEIRGSAQESFFDNYHHRAPVYDIDALKDYYTFHYNSFASEVPFIRHPDSCLPTEERQPAELNTMPDKKWVRLYLFLRAIETRKEWNQTEFDSKANIATNLLSRYDLNKAIEYVNVLFRNSSHKKILSESLTSGTIGDIVSSSHKRPDFRF